MHADRTNRTLLIAELKPARVSRLAADPTEAGADAIDTAYTRRGLAAAIRSAVTAVDGSPASGPLAPSVTAEPW